jgi:hypothetical protein
MEKTSKIHQESAETYALFAQVNVLYINITCLAIAAATIIIGIRSIEALHPTARLN